MLFMVMSKVQVMLANLGKLVEQHGTVFPYQVAQNNLASSDLLHMHLALAGMPFVTMLPSRQTYQM